MENARVDDDILSRIGRTPLVRLKRLPAPGSADVLCKCEQFNPGGSVKDRTALAMVEAAEREGRLVSGKSTLIEATSGNTGIGLALVAAVKGYRLILTMPENMSPERMELLRAYGAELHLTPAERVMRGAVEKAAAIAATTPGAYMPQQFRNPVNPVVHLNGTGPEILEQLGGRAPDAFVAGVGTGGTITGVGQALRARRADVALIAVEPANSAVLSGGPSGPHRIQGIGAGFVPEILDRALLTEVRRITEEEAEVTRLELARREGLLVGISAGAAVRVALDVARALGPGKTVVTVLPDTGERYISVGTARARRT
ncbi:MAG TPA: cysteine synthase A [Polyangia bacterium]|nr:cysteine synthase A [Polyangia bacterium]